MCNGVEISNVVYVFYINVWFSEAQRVGSLKKSSG